MTISLQVSHLRCIRTFFAKPGLRHRRLASLFTLVASMSERSDSDDSDCEVLRSACVIPPSSPLTSERIQDSRLGTASVFAAISTIEDNDGSTAFGRKYNASLRSSLISWHHKYPTGCFHSHYQQFPRDYVLPLPTVSTGAAMSLDSHTIRLVSTSGEQHPSRHSYSVSSLLRD